MMTKRGRLWGVLGNRRLRDQLWRSGPIHRPANNINNNNITYCVCNPRVCDNLTWFRRWRFKARANFARGRRQDLGARRDRATDRGGYALVSRGRPPRSPPPTTAKGPTWSVRYIKPIAVHRLHTSSVQLNTFENQKNQQKKIHLFIRHGIQSEYTCIWVILLRVTRDGFSVYKLKLARASNVRFGSFKSPARRHRSRVRRCSSNV